MSGLQRPTPDGRILELTRRLAEDYPSVPLPEVSRLVKHAADTATGAAEWSGTSEGLPALIDAIELVAREDLDAAREPGAVSVLKTRSVSVADQRRAPRRGVE